MPTDTYDPHLPHDLVYQLIYPMPADTYTPCLPVDITSFIDRYNASPRHDTPPINGHNPYISTDTVLSPMCTDAHWPMDMTLPTNTYNLHLPTGTALIY
jgi:hypothetical protein